MTPRKPSELERSLIYSEVIFDLCRKPAKEPKQKRESRS